MAFTAMKNHRFNKGFIFEVKGCVSPMITGAPASARKICASMLDLLANDLRTAPFPTTNFWLCISYPSQVKIFR
jgi:hypothetical protein